MEWEEEGLSESSKYFQVFHPVTEITSNNFLSDPFQRSQISQANAVLERTGIKLKAKTGHGGAHM